MLVDMYNLTQPQPYDYTFTSRFHLCTIDFYLPKKPVLKIPFANDLGIVLDNKAIFGPSNAFVEMKIHIPNNMYCTTEYFPRKATNPIILQVMTIREAYMSSRSSYRWLNLATTMFAGNMSKPRKAKNIPLFVDFQPK